MSNDFSTPTVIAGDTWMERAAAGTTSTRYDTTQVDPFFHGYATPVVSDLLYATPLLGVVVDKASRAGYATPIGITQGMLPSSLYATPVGATGGTDLPYATPIGAADPAGYVLPNVLLGGASAVNIYQWQRGQRFVPLWTRSVSQLTFYVASGDSTGDVFQGGVYEGTTKLTSGTVTTDGAGGLYIITLSPTVTLQARRSYSVWLGVLGTPTGTENAEGWNLDTGHAQLLWTARETTGSLTYHRDKTLSFAKATPVGLPNDLSTLGSLTVSSTRPALGLF